MSLVTGRLTSTAEILKFLTKPFDTDTPPQTARTTESMIDKLLQHLCFRRVATLRRVGL